jgi:hypothetical protein
MEVRRLNASDVPASNQFNSSGYLYWDRERPARTAPQARSLFSDRAFSRFALSAGGTPAIPVIQLNRFPQVKLHHYRRPG